jgi:hypothetical protein
MTYTVTTTEPGAEPVAIPQSKRKAAIDEIMAVLYGIEDRVDIFTGIANVCLGVLSESGAVKSVSLEWTTEAPKADGAYWPFVYGVVWPTPVKVLVAPDFFRIDWCVDGFEWDAPFNASDVTRWLGPIPLAVTP